MLALGGESVGGVWGWGLKVERPKRDQKGCGAVKSGRVKMARVEVKLLFRFIGVLGRGGAAPGVRAGVGKGWVF